MKCWDVTFPDEWLCFLTVKAPKVVIGHLLLRPGIFFENW